MKAHSYEMNCAAANSSGLSRYVLVTAARNEERLIERTLQSVVNQTQLPLRWIIVDDGSTDRTVELVKRFANGHSWIKLVQRPARAERNFAGKACAVNAGVEHMRDLEFDLIGNLDADISFEPDYLEFLVSKFRSEPKLGVAGTPFIEEGYDSSRDSFEGENYVPGGCQIFRYRCFQEIGGYIPNTGGGVDWIAVMTARMNGWQVRSYPEKRFHHHRTLGTAEHGVLSAFFSSGERDYYLGGSPIWQMFRVAHRMLKRPIITGGLALFSGYSWAALRRTKRAVTPELLRFHRQDQMRKLGVILRCLLCFKRVDNFTLQSGAHHSRSKQ